MEKSPMKTLLTLALFTSLVSTLSASETPVLSCVGTEPFWGISTAANGSLSFGSSATEENKVYSKTTLKKAAGTADGFAFQIEARDSANDVLKLNVVKAECNDGMSDATYTYTALVDVDGGILTGCCN